MNEPIKNCDTCAHQRGRGDFSKCSREGTYCEIVRQGADKPWRQCNGSFSGWVARPAPKPRRSLRQWLYDTFWK